MKGIDSLDYEGLLTLFSLSALHNRHKTKTRKSSKRSWARRIFAERK